SFHITRNLRCSSDAATSIPASTSSIPKHKNNFSNHLSSSSFWYPGSPNNPRNDCRLRGINKHLLCTITNAIINRCPVIFQWLIKEDTSPMVKTLCAHLNITRPYSTLL
ncbi:hypothetical protein HMI55_003968, partial [Coelomomyces lativittatus]